MQDEFFDNQFKSSTYKDTRNQLQWRLDYLKANPLVTPMFYAKQTTLDIEAEMDAGRIIVIDNAKGKLETAGSQFYGRFFLALIRSPPIGVRSARTTSSPATSISTRPRMLFQTMSISRKSSQNALAEHRAYPRPSMDTAN